MKKIIAFIVLIFIGSCNLEDPSKVFDGKEWITISFDHDNIPADGISKRIITIRLEEPITEKTAVNISTDFGTLSTSLNGLDALKSLDLKTNNGVVTAFLTSETKRVDSAIVFASVGEFANLKHLRVTTALPEAIVVIADKYLFPVQDSIIIEARLLRSIGKVSDNVRVDFSVVPKDTSSAQGILIPVVYSSGQKAITTLKSKNLKSGELRVSAKSETFADTLDITVLP